MKTFKPKSHFFKITKLIQSGILFTGIVIYFLFLILNTEFRAAIFYSTLSLFAHILLWIFFIANSIFLYLDLTIYQKAIKESDDIQKNAYLDDLTGMPNRFSCDLVFQMYAEPDKLKHVGCALIVIDNLISINENIGRDAGNQIIIDFSNILEEIGEDYGFVGRNGGNEFLLVIENGTKSQMESFFSQLNTRLKRYNALELNNPIDISYRYVLNDELNATRFSNIITEVYKQVHARDI